MQQCKSIPRGKIVFTVRSEKENDSAARFYDLKISIRFGNAASGRCPDPFHPLYTHFVVLCIQACMINVIAKCADDETI